MFKKILNNSFVKLVLVLGLLYIFLSAIEMMSVAFKLLDQIDPDAAHENLFTTLKTQSIDVEELNRWVDVLNKKRIISTEEYAKFTSNYTTINQLRDEYKQLEHQEIDLINVQQKICIKYL